MSHIRVTVTAKTSRSSLLRPQDRSRIPLMYSGEFNVDTADEKLRSATKEK
jgi:hypothetical protein